MVKRGKKPCKPKRRLQWNLSPESVLPTVGNIEKPIFILLLFIYGRHNSPYKHQTTKILFIISNRKDKQSIHLHVTNLQQFTCRWEDIVHKYKDRLFCTQFDPFADNIDKLSYSQVSWDKVPAIFRFRLYGKALLSSRIWQLMRFHA